MNYIASKLFFERDQIVQFQNKKDPERFFLFNFFIFLVKSKHKLHHIINSITP